MSDLLQQANPVERQQLHRESRGVGVRGDTIRKKLLEQLLGEEWKYHRQFLEPLEVSNVAKHALTEDMKGLKTVLRNDLNAICPEPMVWYTYEVGGNRLATLQLMTPLIDLPYGRRLEALRSPLNFLDRATGRVFSEDKYKGPPPNARWAVVQGHFAHNWEGHSKAAPFGGTVQYLGKEGRVVGAITLFMRDEDPIHSRLFSSTVVEMAEDAEIPEKARDLRGQKLEEPGIPMVCTAVASLANILQNCVNVRLSRPSSRFSRTRKLAKKDQMPYRTVVLSKILQEIEDRQDGVLAKHVYLPEHLQVVKGHFKDYRDSENGLFGKYKDVWWWSQHSRDANGEVSQDDQ